MTSLRRKAGDFLGFDLAGLFKDEEDGGLKEAGFAPYYQVSSNVKGRGGALSYKAPKQPSRVATFGIEPTRLAGQGPLTLNVSQQQEQTQAAPAPAPAPAPEPEKPKTYTYTDPGDQGYFGIKDYNELLSQGAPESLIKEYAGKAQYGVGPLAAQILGMQPYTETQGKTTQFPITTQTIAAPTPAPAPEPQKTYTYTDPGDKGYFGRKDFEELAGQGASLDVIRDYARRSPLGVGAWAKDVLGL